MEAAAAAASDVGMSLPRGHSHSFDRQVLARECEEYELASAILVPSDYVLESFLERGFSRARLVRHRYGYDPTRFFPSTEPRSPDDEFRAVFVGRGEPNKGLHLALRAWVDSGAAERGKFLVCGQILPQYAASLRPMLDLPSVQELGWLADVADVMRHSDVLVLPSLTEGSALVTYEAQGCGCALVVSTASGADLTHLREGLLHTPGDIGALTDHLELLSTDRALLQRLQANARAHRFEITWERSGELLAAIYRERARRA
jgi:glycosyltransferase involved in cell wall biosynthesis